MLGFVLFSNDRFYPYEVEGGGGGGGGGGF